MFLKANFSSNITPREPKISPLTKFHKLFKHDVFYAQSHMLMKKNVNNDVSKDSAIVRIVANSSEESRIVTNSCQ